MNKRTIKTYIALLVCTGILTSISAAAWSEAGTTEKTPDTDYSSYMSGLGQAEYSNAPVELRAIDLVEYKDLTIVAGESYNGRDSVLVIENEIGTATWEFESQAGVYEIDIEYASLESYRAKISFGIQIDGRYPYDELETVELARPWKHIGQIQSDVRGNDLLPDQEQSYAWQSAKVYDANGKYDAPLRIELTEGIHTITFVFNQAQAALDTITLSAPEVLPTYAQVYAGYQSQGLDESSTKSLTVEGETPILRSDSSILPQYDKSDAYNQPVDAQAMLINVIGGTTWADSHRWIEWEIDIPESGLYKIGMRVKQNYKYGAIVYRRIYIDGKVPFQELYNVTFNYLPSWYMKVLGDDDPYSIYLTEGKHTLRMEAVTGDYEAIIDDLEDTLFDLNNLYRNVMMITGPIPDSLRDYDLETGIPDLMDRLEQIQANLKRQKAYVENSLIKTGSETAILESINLQIDGFIKDTESIPFRLDSLKANVSALADWLMDLNEQPLTIDHIDFIPTSNEFKKANARFFEGLWFTLRTILYSFSSDYGIIGDYSQKGKVLTVWLGSGGRDQMQIIKNLIDNSFAIDNNTKINLNLVQGSLINSILAGKSPDVSLFVGIGDPVNLAARGALTDLSSFDDFNVVASNYYPNTLVPYMYKDKCYGIPITQEFPMMFYRTDVLKEFELEVPESWDDIRDIAPTLQRKNLQIGIPSGLISSGIFPSLLIQNGIEYYTADRSRTRFNEEEAIEAFDMWTQFFSKYGFPLQYDFYNRFRSGEMPIGIASYSMYGFLDIAAPEISGLWEMTTIPGTVQEDGTINKSASSFGGTAAIILNNSKDKESAWEFVKWFTSTSMQSEYGNAIEALLGPAGRYTTANRYAIDELPWSQSELDLLKSQWSQIVEVGVIPASYYVDRNICNAFKSVIYKASNPRSTLSNYAFEINNEITRKNAEIGDVG